jgi:tellurite resistance protein TehA-like permease
MQIAPIPDTLIFSLSQSDLGVGVSLVIWIVTVAGVVAFCVWAQVNLQRLWSAWKNASPEALPPQNKMQIAPIPDTGVCFGDSFGRKGRLTK